MAEPMAAAPPPSDGSAFSEAVSTILPAESTTR
jgi:hypothetical protein